eukprot:COSAG02_NODE_4055_length_5840_cov_3.261656_2_plen_62_part_00
MGVTLFDERWPPSADPEVGRGASSDEARASDTSMSAMPAVEYSAGAVNAIIMMCAQVHKWT